MSVTTRRASPLAVLLAVGVLAASTLAGAEVRHVAIESRVDLLGGRPACRRVVPAGGLHLRLTHPSVELAETSLPRPGSNDRIAGCSTSCSPAS